MYPDVHAYIYILSIQPAVKQVEDETKKRLMMIPNDNDDDKKVKKLIEDIMTR